MLILPENNVNQETNFEHKLGRSTTEKVLDRSKIDEQLNLNNLLGRRRSQLFLSNNNANNVNSEKETLENIQGFELKSESRDPFQKVTDYCLLL